jgi:mevalonate kinase
MLKIATEKSKGKIILSGEHSVVYGKPAIAIPTNLSATCKIKPNKTDKIKIVLKNYQKKNIYTKTKLHKIKNEIVGQITSHFLKKYKTEFKNLGLTITIKSNIPIGAGMGSSAAIIVATIKAFLKLLKIKKTNYEIFTLALKFENIIHGNASGIDIAVSLYNKPIKYIKNKPIEILNFSIPQFHIIYSGKPKSTTYECVKYVNANYASNKKLWNEFANCTEKILHFLKKQNPKEIKDTIKKNHRLLLKIDVVSKQVSLFINEIKAKHGAAKISGAGTIEGNANGIIIAFNISKTKLKKITKTYKYKIY